MVAADADRIDADEAAGHGIEAGRQHDGVDGEVAAAGPKPGFGHLLDRLSS